VCSCLEPNAEWHGIGSGRKSGSFFGSRGAGTALLSALADLEIAAIATVNQFILVTGNVRRFTGFPELSVENWRT